jgi:hypothetical protein
MSLTQSELKEVLLYNSESGEFYWKENISARARKGQNAGTKSNGYIRITKKYIKYTAHRRAWLYMTGEWPRLEIDRKNHNPSDNRFINLRSVSHQENHKNHGQRSAA